LDAFAAWAGGDAKRLFVDAGVLFRAVCFMRFARGIGAAGYPAANDELPVLAAAGRAPEVILRAVSFVRAFCDPVLGPS